ncbi:MAG: hypothetical protein HC927_01075 [Deltaproteobacteria bacterium]|nr:hypothetical protein [Deltaproteobacteria bacterium]
MYTLPVDESGSFEGQGIEPGSYSLSLRHSLGAVKFSGPEKVELSEGQQSRVELELAAQQQRFTGVVVDEDGGAVEAR